MAAALDYLHSRISGARNQGIREIPEAARLNAWPPDERKIISISTLINMNVNCHVQFLRNQRQETLRGGAHQRFRYLKQQSLNIPRIDSPYRSSASMKGTAVDQSYGLPRSFWTSLNLQHGI